MTAICGGVPGAEQQDGDLLDQHGLPVEPLQDGGGTGPGGV